MKKILNEWKRFLLKEGAPNVPFDDEFLETEECVYGMTMMKNIILFSIEK